jgi:hypothetical protein
MSAAVERYVLLPGLGVVVVGFILVIAGGDSGRSHVVKVAGLVVLAVGAAVLLLGGLATSFLPRLEILPKGAQTRRSKVLRWTRREAAWLTRNVFLIVLGIGLTLLFQRIT